MNKPTSKKKNNVRRSGTRAQKRHRKDFCQIQKKKFTIKTMSSKFLNTRKRSGSMPSRSATIAASFANRSCRVTGPKKRNAGKCAAPCCPTIPLFSTLQGIRTIFERILFDSYEAIDPLHLKMSEYAVHPTPHAAGNCNCTMSCSFDQRYG